MNDRIKELAEQAGLYDFVVDVMGIDEEMQKFAELIIREVLSEVKDEIQYLTSFSDSEFIDKKLKTYFGVE